MAVLTVLLTILKIIGIVLLVLLCLIAAIVLLVLFAPVRYRAHVQKEEAGAEEQSASDPTGSNAGRGSEQDAAPMHLGARLTWLLKLLSVDVCYPAAAAGSGFAVSVRLGPKIIWSNQKEKAKEKPAAEPTEKSDAGPALQSSASASSEKTHCSDQKKSEGEQRRKEKGSREKEKGGSWKEKGGSERTEKEKAEKRRREKEKSGGGLRTKGKSGGSRKAKAVQKIRALWEKGWNFIARLLEAPADAGDMIDGLVSKIERKIRSLKKRFGPLTDADARKLYGKIFRELKFLLSCYAPKKAEGYLRFGTDSPDTTGTLVGLIYLLLPADSDDFELQPDFFGSTLSADMTLSGCIRLCHAARVGVSLIRDREFRRLLAFIRHRGDSSGTREQKEAHSAADTH